MHACMRPSTFLQLCSLLNINDRSIDQNNHQYTTMRLQLLRNAVDKQRGCRQLLSCMMMFDEVMTR